ncbi:MAG: rhodanese-like domain-containing protein [Vulcanimicrobiaceae bacterium]
MSSDISYIDPDLVNGKTIPVLDVRRHRHGEQIRGAVHYDARKLREAGKLVLPLPHDTPIAVYSDDDESAQTIVAALVASGYNAAILNGGIEEWKRRGYATEAATQDQPIPGEDSAGIPRF